MSFVGWLGQPAVLPWVALVFGLCVGSFLNVVIHRLPKMLEREWRAQCAELAAADAPAVAQRPRSVIHETRGMLCLAGIGLLQPGHAERGVHRL